jgi:hypothetical protein
MNSEKKTVTTLEDPKINIKTKLAGLWVVLMFFYLYNDVFTLHRPGFIEGILAEEIEGTQFNQAFLLGAAIIMAIPSVMVFLSLTLKAKANRWANIIVGIFYGGLLLFTIPGGIWAYYALYMIVEAVFIALIVWYAWKWPKQEERKVVAT